MSTGLMNKLKWGDGLKVNGVRQLTNYPVRPGDVITVTVAEEEPEYPAQDSPLEILYEDDHLVAVEKPAGMLIHPSRSRFNGTLANYVQGYFSRSGQKSAFHPVTRLDRDTFGIVLLGKNAHIHARMQQIAVEKIYHALVFGGPETDIGIIDAPIARKPLPSLLREVREDGKPCLTKFEVLEHFAGYSRLALQPVTGRTHQLRVHCAHAGFPILGDPQYGNEESLAFSARFGLQSQLLCAKELHFVHPVTGKMLHLHSNMDVKL